MLLHSTLSPRRQELKIPSGAKEIPDSQNGLLEIEFSKWNCELRFVTRVTARSRRNAQHAAIAQTFHGEPSSGVRISLKRNLAVRFLFAIIRPWQSHGDKKRFSIFSIRL